MTYRAVMSALKAYGTAQNRKIYARHGVEGPMFGVSFANLDQLKRRIKSDHTLAVQLWNSRNHDARILTTMIADPRAASAKLLDGWKNQLDNYVVTDEFSGFAAKTPSGRTRMERWIKSPREWVGRAGWLVLAHIARDIDALGDDYFEAFLPVVEKRIHGAKNRTRDAMNSAVIAIGIRNARLERKAIAVARRIGRVDVDHGETSCKTPDADTYILKARARRAAR